MTRPMAAGGATILVAGVANLPAGSNFRAKEGNRSRQSAHKTALHQVENTGTEPPVSACSQALEDTTREPIAFVRSGGGAWLKARCMADLLNMLPCSNRVSKQAMWANEIHSRRGNSVNLAENGAGRNASISQL